MLNWIFSSNEAGKKRGRNKKPLAGKRGEYGPWPIALSRTSGAIAPRALLSSAHLFAIVRRKKLPNITPDCYNAGRFASEGARKPEAENVYRGSLYLHPKTKTFLPPHTIFLLSFFLRHPRRFPSPPPLPSGTHIHTHERIHISRYARMMAAARLCEPVSPSSCSFSFSLARPLAAEAGHRRSDGSDTMAELLILGLCRGTYAVDL